MRIVLVYQHFMVSGVGSTKPYDLARHLRAAGHRVTVICGRGYLSQGMDVPRRLVCRLDVGGIEVLCLGVDYAQRMGFPRRVAAFLAFTLLAMLVAAVLPRYDVLLASSTPLTVGLVGLVARYVRRVPFVLEVRDLWPEVPFRAGFLRSRAIFRLSTVFEEWFYREASVVCAISEGMVRRLVERGVPAGKVHFLPTGVDLAAFDVPADEGFLREHGLAGRFVAVYLGAHGRVNRLDYAVDAAGHLRPDEGITLLLIGDGSEKPRLVGEARRGGLDDGRLLFLPPICRARVPGVLKACDGMLMLNSPRPGMEYLMTNKFFDYLAAGRPLVVNVRAELTDVILNARCGLLASEKDPADLLRLLRRLRDDGRLAARLGRNARRLAEQKFDRGKLNVEWERLLCRASGRRPPPAGGHGREDAALAR